MTAPRLRRPARALAFPLLAVALTVSSLLVMFGGCGLSTGGIPSGTGGGTACTAAAQCDDGNACTTDACDSSGTCTHTGIADGPLPASAQTPGNCQKLVCMGGEPMTEDDPTNVPANANPCVKEECANGMALADMTANDGKPCTAGSNAGICKTGMCSVTCMQSSDCPNTNPCVVPFCDGATGTCSSTNVADGTMTPGYVQMTGDCVVHVCVGGVDTAENDDSDVPAIPSGEDGCADAVCNSGVGSNPKHAVNSVCSTYMGNLPGYCNAAGNCVECAADVDCPGTTTDCQHPACQNDVCGTAFAANGTPTTTTPAQTPGDCHQVQCDVSGATKNAVDQTDPPTANACDTFGCDTSGNVTNTYHPGVMCGTSSTGMAEFCNNMGQCGCQGNQDCLAATCGSSATVVTLAQSCMNMVCVTPSPATHNCSPFLCSNGACTTSCTADNQCASQSYCASNSKCMPQGDTGAPCTAADQCKSGFCTDSVCCTTDCTGLTCQACSAAKKGQGADGICGAVKLGQDAHGDCSDMGAASCGESGGCNGSGACSTYAAGTQCKAPSCNGTTLTQAALCAAGACPGTQTMVNCAPYLCSSAGNGSCTNSCTDDSKCASTAYCNTSTKKCITKLGTGTGTCMANDQCMNGICGSNGICCAGATACAPGTGACANLGCAPVSGACTYPASGTACGSSCSGTNVVPKTCDGMGACNSGSAMACGNNFACTGSACPTSCTPGMTAGCLANNTCNTGGTACLSSPGQGCSGSGTTCSSGVCGSNNVCCASTTTCSPGTGACANTGCSATNGACTYPPSGTPCGTSCTNGAETDSTCNATGSCNAGAPMACGINLGCNGNVCNTTCTLTTSMGCLNSNYTCTALAVCGLNAGQSCTPPSPGNCASGVCLGTSPNAHCCSTLCSTSGTCGATGCDASGTCQYPGSSTPCGTPSCSNGNLTTGACNQAGSCTTSSNVCPNNLACADGQNCSMTLCTVDGTGATGDGACAQGYYCDGSACQPQIATGQGTCTRNGDCVSNSCCLTGACTHGNCN